MASWVGMDAKKTEQKLDNLVYRSRYGRSVACSLSSIRNTVQPLGGVRSNTQWKILTGLGIFPRFYRMGQGNPIP